MAAFVPGGQAGQESQRLTREAEAEAAMRREGRGSKPPKRPSLLKRILRKARRGK